jgi:outer membrane protein TolC
MICMKYFAVIIVLYIPFSLFGYSPKELALKAVERAPQIRMEFENLTVSDNQLKQSERLSNPQVIVQSGRLKSGDSQGSIVDFTLNQPLPWPGKMKARVKSSELLKKIAQLDLKEAQILIHQTTLLLSLEIATLQELEKHHWERKKIFSLISRYLSTRPLPSPKQIIEKDLINTQISIVENFMNELVVRKKSLLMELEILTGLDKPTVHHDWQKQITLPPIENFLNGLNLNPNALRSQEKVALAKNQVEEARLESRPDIFIGVNYRQENVLPVNHFYQAQIGFSIPLMDNGTYNTGKARAQYRREEIQSQLLSSQIERKIKSTYLSLESSYLGMNLFKLSELQSSEKKLKNSEIAFLKGRLDALTFLQTDTQIHETLDLAYNSYLKYFENLGQLKSLTGQYMDF